MERWHTRNRETRWKCVLVIQARNDDRLNKTQIQTQDIFEGRNNKIDCLRRKGKNKKPLINWIAHIITNVLCARWLSDCSVASYFYKIKKKRKKSPESYKLVSFAPILVRFLWEMHKKWEAEHLIRFLVSQEVCVSYVILGKSPCFHFSTL